MKIGQFVFIYSPGSVFHHLKGQIADISPDGGFYVFLYAERDIQFFNESEVKKL